jgi:hypothetical protein
MENISALSRGTKILGVAGVLLLVDTFLAWQSVDLGILEVSRNAWHGFWGVLTGIMLIALLGWVGAHIANVELPADLPEGLITLVLGALIFLFAVIKGLTDDYSTAWSWLGIIFAAGVAVGAWLRYQEAAGTFDNLTSSTSSRPEPAAPATPTAPAPTTPTPPAASAPSTEPMPPPAPVPPPSAPESAPPPPADEPT